jgi:hypothetical protein
MNFLIRTSAIAVVVAVISVPLHADLRITSTVEVKDERPQQTSLSGQIAVGLMPFRAVAGKANVTTLAAGGFVRVEGLGPVLGLPSDAVLISTEGGRTVCLLPTRREFFIIENPTLNMSRSFKMLAKTKRRGTSDVLLGEKVERKFVSVNLDLNVPDEGMRSQESFIVHESQRDTDAEWQASWTRSGFPRRIPRADDPITIESWYSTSFGPEGRSVAASQSHVTWLASAGLSSLADRPFALREVVLNPVHGYRMETHVTAVQDAAVDPAVFAIPADYVEVAAPPPPRTITLDPFRKR